MGSSEGGRSSATVSMADMARRWRVPEFVGFGIALITIILLEESIDIYKQFIPENSRGGVNSYPVRLGSEWCTAGDLSICHSQVEQSACCKEMEAGAGPEETVPTFLLWLIYFGVPIIFIAVRHTLKRLGLYKVVGTLADVLLGLMVCLGLCVTATDGIKIMVGRPRPNLFALRALVEFGGGTSSLEEKSIRSFPSGHSSQSMAGTLYVTLVCWGDLSRYAATRKGWRRSVCAYLSMLPALISIWVGATRVRDYWHFQDDVLAGWAIGAVSAAVAVRWVTFPEAFWQGVGREREDSRSWVDSHSSDLRSLEHRGALALMVGSPPGSRVGTSSDLGGADLERGVI